MQKTFKNPSVQNSSSRVLLIRLIEMHKFLILLVVGILGAFFLKPSSGQVRQISSEMLEKINVDTYLQNKRLVEYHINCLVYNGPCDKIGNEIKRLFNTFRSTGISTSECRLCTEDQKQKLTKIARHWQTNYPAAWRDLSALISR